MNPYAYIKRLYELDRLHAQAREQNPEKAERARYLGRLDRNLSPEEWEEFKQLVQEGY